MNKHLLYIFFLIFFLLPLGIKSQTSNYVSDKLYPSIINRNYFEINKIQFIGAEKLDPNLLNEFISSKATESNLPYQFFVSYYREFDKNPSMIRYLQNEFRKGLLKLRDDVPYFDKITAESDVLSLENYYEINGLHFAKVKFEFVPNPSKVENILNFYIEEGDRYTIDTVIYTGFEKLPNEQTENLKRFKGNFKKSPFNEVLLLNEIKNINSYLRENGYFYSSFSQPRVEIDTLNKTDKIFVEFNVGNRYRIGKIDFIDSANKQPLIASQMKYKQLEMIKGDWVNPKKIEASKDNLLSLGTFEIVAIDTSSRYSPQNDSTLNFVAFLLYRKEQEMNFGVSLNQTRLDNFINLGFETSYRHRNFLGAAQEFSPFANVYLKDLGTVLSTKTYEFEAQVGFKYAQPLLWTIGNSRVSFISSFLFSYKLLNNYFKISSFNFPISFPVKLPKITYFDRASFDLSFLRENPVNFHEVFGEALSKAKSEQDSNNVYQALLLYKDLSDYLTQGQFHFFTSNTIGMSVTGDTRNNPFSPTKGYFTFIGIDGWNPIFFVPQVSGLARYVRLQLNHNQFFKLSPTTVLALKGKFGGISLLESNNNYVPVDRQFFCGGPNSVRAWPSRLLRYTKKSSENINSTLNRFNESFIGNGVLIEGSVEFRFGFAKFPGLNQTLQSALENFKTTLFLDFGNAFHWYSGMNEEDYKVSFTDYITKLAVGTGIGLRYETPIGPVRIDFAFPLIDPLKIRKPFSTMQFNFGIGHAF